MTAYLSAAWQEAAAAVIGADRELQQMRRVRPLVLAQVVVAADDSEDVLASWHIDFGSDGVAWRPGPTPDADVTFTCAAETAWSIHSGEQSAQSAFMAGRLRVGGDTYALLANQDLLATLDDALAPMRATTTPAHDA